MRETDRLFHQTIAEATQNRLLRAFIDWAYEVLQPQLILVTDPVIDFSRLLRQHRSIFAAIEAGKAARAERPCATTSTMSRRSTPRSPEEAAVRRD